MRIDKYLKMTRLIKRRTTAKLMIDNGKVKINQKIIKASAAVKIGDHIEITIGQKSVFIEVTDILTSTKKDEAKYMYKIIDNNEVKK